MINKNNLFIVLLIFLMLPVIFPLFTNGFFVTDDAEWMIIRFSAFHQALGDGQFPVRFLGRLNQEYGYPVANFLYPGFMYLAEPLHLIGFGFVNSIKIILGLSIITSGVFTYLWLRRFFDSFSSFTGALFYVYTPYHLYDLYKRGSVGELLSLAVVPFVLWQIERRSLAWSSLGIALLILSHNTLAVLFLAIIFCYILLDFFVMKKKTYGMHYIGMLFFGLGISAFFWIPALFELQYTVFSKTIVSNWQEYFAPFSLVGYSTIVVLLLTILHVGLKKINVKKHRLMVMFFAFAVVSLFLATPISSALWNILPVSFVQFPYRFLSITLLCTAFLVAGNIAVSKNRKKVFIGLGLLVVLLFSSLPFLKPNAYFDKGEGYYFTNMATTTVLDEYMPIWVQDKSLQRSRKKVEIINGEGSIDNIAFNSTKAVFSADLLKDSVIRVNMIYWPGWEASVDGKLVPISYNNQGGLIEFVVPQGRHSIEVGFGETPLRLVSDAVSAVSLLLLIFMSFRLRNRNHK